jgi:hypothetical protein
VAVTDERGAYRVPARVGGYRLTAELPGFATVTRSGITLLVGQTATVNLQLSVTGVAETVTVTSEAPLINTTQSSIGGNIDPRQMQELPVQGREWMSLALLAPGNRTNAIGETPVQDRGDVREFQMNMDGQQVTSQLGPGGQPRFSRDQIAEFQFISNRFDATQGRSSGVQVNAITRSGTNEFAGTFGSYFRDSDWGSADHVLGRKVPFSEQQYSFGLGGPVLRDRFHFFANYEYDRSPRSSTANTGFPSLDVSLSGIQTSKLGAARLDYQITSANRLMVKGDMARFYRPFADLTTDPWTGAFTHYQKTTNLVLQLTSVLSNRALNEVRFGPASYRFQEANYTTWSRHPRASEGITNGHPRIQLTGFNVAGNTQVPRYQGQDAWLLRDDFTFSYTGMGRHDLKVGGEFLLNKIVSFNCQTCMSQIDARGGPLPANFASLIPDVWNADTWNLNALAPITRSVIFGIGKFRLDLRNPKWAGWIQDDWTVSDRLTLNLGLRYDLIWNATAQDKVYEPWLKPDRPQDANNFQPRLGAAYQLNDRTVLRGGGGLYFPDVIQSQVSWSTRISQMLFIRVANDGRPDFPSNPFNGPIPSYEQALQLTCDGNPALFAQYQARNYTGTAPCLYRDVPELAPPTEYANSQYSWQMSAGFQRQLDDDMAIEMDWIHNRGRREKVLHDNVNLTYNPATGANYPFTDIGRRVYPEWGAVGYYAFTGRSDYHGLQSVFTKRFSDRWQLSANYTLSQIKNDEPSEPISGHTVVTFPVAADLGGEYGLALTDQRHRAVLNGIWQVGYGFQLSGLYFYGSGQRQETNCGGERRIVGAGGTSRLCADGTILARNSFVQDPMHRVDVRLQQRVPVGGGIQVDGILELFNLFNRENYGSFVTDRSNARYGQPNYSSNLAYAPRTMQLGFRVQF